MYHLQLLKNLSMKELLSKMSIQYYTANMDSNNVQVLVGLDAITDYSENFKDGKEDLYDVLNEVKAACVTIAII